MKSLFDHVARGDIGRVLHVETNFSHDLFDNLSKDNWRFNPKDAPGGGFTARGIHLTDFMVHMFGGAKRFIQQCLALPMKSLASILCRQILNLVMVLLV